ncbi:MAG TPA: hypothetical protein VLT45_22275 [Kofleriaceae bacterium]|nr:hypothetical protein [Kofleriaceae bacterium]
MSNVIAFLIAHKAELIALLGALYTAASIVVGMLPQSASKKKIVAAMEWLSFIKHSDTPGSIKSPFMSAVVKLAEAAVQAGPGVPPRGNSGHARTDALGFVIAAWLVGSLLASIALHGCASAQHPRPWDENAHATVNGATHTLRAIDTGITTRYQQLAPDASDLATFERPYQTALHAEHDALDSLLTAEHLIDAAVATGAAPDRCRAGVAVAHARGLVTDAVNLASDFGVTVSGDASATINALEQLAMQLAPSCADGGA